MQEHQLSLTERYSERFLSWLSTNRLTFLSSMVFGLIAHMFVLTNKLPNHDDVIYLFDKGATVSSGRWGLELLRYIIPDYSMPWLHGVISLILLSVSISIIVQMFQFQSRLSQILLSGLIISFPAQIGTFCYMYTSSCYAVAFLSCVLAVQKAAETDWKSWLLSAFLITFMLSIYQAYLSIASSLMILLLIKELLSCRGENLFPSVLKRGILFVGILFAGFELYRLSITLSLSLFGVSVNQYSSEAKEMAPSFPGSIMWAYRFFVYNLTSRYNMIVVSKASRTVHLLCLGLTALGIAVSQFRARNIPNLLLLLFCLILLPLSICCLYMAFYWNTLHTLVLYSYFTLYLLAALSVEQFPHPADRAARDLMHIGLTLILGINICFANRCYLKLFLEYENAYSLATTLVTQIRSLPGYDPDDRVVIFPSAGDVLEFAPEFGTGEEAEHDLMGIQIHLLTGYNEEEFIRRFIGAELNVVSRDQAEREITDRDFERMPVYPADGSVKRIEDGLIFVKFANPPEE